MPDPSITILQPTAGATVSTNFPAGGQVFPASASVSGYMWNRNTNIQYPPVNVTVNPDGIWSMLFQNIPPDKPYSLVAWITNTAIQDQHDNLTVQ